MSNHSKNAPAWITCSYLEKMLHIFSKDNSIRVHNFNIEPGSSVGDNYVGQIFRIKCDFKKGNEIEPRSIIAKAAPDTDLVKEISNGFDFFRTEVKMLSETLPLLLQELPESQPFYPIFYKIDDENKMFYMQDLKAEEYVLANRILSLDLDHVLLVIKTLAKMHAASYLLFKKNPDHKNNYLDYILKIQENSFVQKLIEGRKYYFLKSLPMWPISEEDKAIFRKFKFYDTMLENYLRNESCFNVLIHGDCWTNNVMFKYKNGKPISVKLIDYQLSNYNSIGLDLNFFLFTSAKKNVKVHHLEDVLKTYYDTFISITGDIDGFTIDTVHNEFIKKLGYGFCIAYLFRPGDMSDTPSDMESYFECQESENNNKIFQNEKFVSEAIELLPLFKKYGVFK